MEENRKESGDEMRLSMRLSKSITVKRPILLKYHSKETRDNASKCIVITLVQKVTYMYMKILIKYNFINKLIIFQRALTIRKAYKEFAAKRIATTIKQINQLRVKCIGIQNKRRIVSLQIYKIINQYYDELAPIIHEYHLITKQYRTQVQNFQILRRCDLHIQSRSQVYEVQQYSRACSAAFTKQDRIIFMYLNKVLPRIKEIIQKFKIQKERLYFMYFSIKTGHKLRIKAVIRRYMIFYRRKLRLQIKKIRNQNILQQTQQFLHHQYISINNKYLEYADLKVKRKNLTQKLKKTIQQNCIMKLQNLNNQYEQGILQVHMESDEAKELLYGGLKLYMQYYTPIPILFQKLIVLIKEKYYHSIKQFMGLFWKNKCIQYIISLTKYKLQLYKYLYLKKRYTDMYLQITIYKRYLKDREYLINKKYYIDIEMPSFKEQNQIAFIIISAHNQRLSYEENSELYKCYPESRYPFDRSKNFALFSKIIRKLKNLTIDLNQYVNSYCNNYVEEALLRSNVKKASQYQFIIEKRFELQIFFTKMILFCFIELETRRFQIYYKNMIQIDEIYSYIVNQAQHYFYKILNIEEQKIISRVFIFTMLNCEFVFRENTQFCDILFGGRVIVSGC